MAGKIFIIWKRKILHEPGQFLAQAGFFLILFLLLFTLRILSGGIDRSLIEAQKSCPGTWQGLWAETVLGESMGSAEAFPEDFLEALEAREEIRELDRTAVRYIEPGNFRLAFDGEDLRNSVLYSILKADGADEEEASASLGKLVTMKNLEEFPLFRSGALKLSDEQTAQRFTQSEEGVVASQDLLERNGLREGDTLEILYEGQRLKLRIIGSFRVPLSTTYYVREDYRNLLFARDRLAMTLGGQEQVTGFRAVFSSALHMSGIVEELKGEWGPVFQKFYSYVNDTDYKNRRALLEGMEFYLKTLQGALWAVFLLVCGLYAYYQSMGKRQEMGIWISLGAGRGTILLTEFLYLLSAAGAGFLLGALGSGVLAAMFERNWTFLQAGLGKLRAWPAAGDLAVALCVLVLVTLGSCGFSVLMNTRADNRTLLED